MCGIAGLIGAGPDPTDDVRRMCDVLVHRGPDGGAVWNSGPCTLGHRRLAILDLTEAGRQPMFSADGRLALVYNGEVYNYLELRDELRRAGSTFRTDTDSEVVLEAYRVWGPDCVRGFNGMWALAIHDTAAGTLFLSRDRLGIKPLYLLRTADELLFASEIKAILAVRPAERRPNVDHLARFLARGLRDVDESTAFANVRSFPAAHSAIVDVRTRAVRAWAYWEVPTSVPSSSDEQSSDERVAELRALLDSSIGLRLRSDVPVGTCLSGGVDSSTIAALATRQLTSPIHTFSGLYEDRACNEERYVDAVNAHVGAVPHAVRPQPRGDLLDDLRRIAWHQDEPTAGPGLYTQFHVMRRAHRDVRVLLDGQGGDELFAGYLFYFQTAFLEMMRRRPVLGRMRTAVGIASVARHWGAGAFPRALDTLLGGWPARLLGRTTHAAPGLAILHDDVRERATACGPLPVANTFDDDVTNLLRHHVVRESLPTLLHYEDRNSMAWSIEARVPLLDHRIVEFAFRTPVSAKLHGTWTKWILRRAAEDALPRSVVWRRSKMGYPTPFARWLREERESIAGVLLSDGVADRGLFSAQEVGRLWREHLAGADHSWALYRVLSTEFWFQSTIDGGEEHRVETGRTIAPTVVLDRTARRAS